jgi:hypothetical protein
MPTEWESGKWARLWTLTRIVINGDHSIYVLICNNHRASGTTNPKAAERALRELQKAERKARQLRLFNEAAS